MVSGDGSPGLSITYPSPLEKSPIIYNLYLTPDQLPQTEEFTISGPITDKIHIQVCSVFLFLTESLFVIFFNVNIKYSLICNKNDLFAIFIFVGVSEIRARVWRPYHPKHLIPVLLSEAVSAERAAKGRWSTVISACSVTCSTGNTAVTI